MIFKGWLLGVALFAHPKFKLQQTEFASFVISCHDRCVCVCLVMPGEPW